MLLPSASAIKQSYHKKYNEIAQLFLNYLIPARVEVERKVKEIEG